MRSLRPRCRCGLSACSHDVERDMVQRLCVSIGLRFRYHAPIVKCRFIRTDFAVRKIGKREADHFHGPTRSSRPRPVRICLMRQWAHTVMLATVAPAAALAAQPAAGEALLLIEADSGKVLHAENATYPWHPASVTKLMTTYVTLRAVKDGRLGIDSLLTVSRTAASQQPSKMGFKPGTKLTVDNALKMLMV